MGSRYLSALLERHDLRGILTAARFTFQPVLPECSIWRLPMIRLHKPIAALAFLLLAAFSSSCTPGGPGARSMNEPLNIACADGFKPKGDGSCSF